MDIRSKITGPGGKLTNFTAFSFEVDGVKCSSMEGFLQSLKKNDIQLQIEVCQLVGIDAKRWGENYNDNWKAVQTLWWQGKAYDRHSQDYQDLLDRAYESLFLNEEFRKTLLETGDEILTHSIGNHDPSQTILTEKEFCSRLMKLRDRLYT